jgi:DNA-binding ferritin-like protein (Dps family)
MAKNLIELVTGSLEDKKRWKAYKARVKQLPATYREVAKGVERYLMHSGAGPIDGGRAMTMFEGLADLFEGAAADATPVRDLVGEDPVAFAETFAATYSDGGWIANERRRLAETIDRASDEAGA